MTKIHNPLKKTVYALCEHNGMFTELLLIHPQDIISDNYEVPDSGEIPGERFSGEPGSFVLKYKEKGKIHLTFYLEKIEV